MFLTNCSTTEEDFPNLPVETLYREAKELLDAGSFTKAAKAFAEVERQHPYSNWSVKAQLMSAYAYYEAKKYEEAIESFNTFVQLHPGHDNVPYALYMIGLCNYEQVPTVERDQKSTAEALDAFKEIIRRFPQSVYAKDAKFKIDLLHDHLAGKEMEVGRFYQNKKSYLAAVNRFKKVVEDYQMTSLVPEALHRMVECYIAMGIIDQAQAAATILSHNFPGSNWYEDTYNIMNKYYPQLIAPSKEGSKKSDLAIDPKLNPKPPIN